VDEFPPAYSIIRACKFKNLGTTRLASVFGLARKTGGKLGIQKGGLSVPGDGRTFVAQNYHCPEKGLNISISIGKPSKGNQDDMPCLACPTAHSIATRFAKSMPTVFVITDQNFPAVLPASKGDCVVILRVEDGSLFEIMEAFVDRFRAHLAPHGSLPAGSVILLGSLSHLRTRGIANYAESLVSVIGNILGRAGAGVDVAPLVMLQMHGIESAALIRSLLDLDSWYLSCQENGTILQDSRNVFWGVITRDADLEPIVDTGTYTLMLPVSIRNHRTRPVVSDPFDRPIPSSLPPITEAKEKEILLAMFTEVNEVYGLALDKEPDVTRCTDPTTRHDCSRTVLIGASHMARVAAALTKSGVEVTALCTPGWVSTKDKLKSAADFCSELQLSNEDIVIIDLWSNSAFMGTDEMGLPSRAFKDPHDNKYHVLGALQAAPKSVFQVVLWDAAPLLAAAASARIILVTPFPRYVAGACCNDTSHMPNIGTDDFYDEICKATAAADAAAAADDNASGCTMFHIGDIFSDTTIPDWTTADGIPVWSAGDPVHATPGAYAAIGDALLTCSLASEKSRKRQRLESIVPGNPAAKRRGGPAVRPPAWVAGLSSSRRGSGEGRGRGGSHFTRGGSFLRPWRARGGYQRGGRGRGGRRSF
jgi:hypothetical protein